MERYDLKKEIEMNKRMEIKKSYPCTNTKCSMHDETDPDGFNCHLFYPPSNECEDYEYDLTLVDTTKNDDIGQEI